MIWGYPYFKKPPNMFCFDVTMFVHFAPWLFFGGRKVFEWRYEYLHTSLCDATQSSLHQIETPPPLTDTSMLRFFMFFSSVSFQERNLWKKFPHTYSSKWCATRCLLAPRCSCCKWNYLFSRYRPGNWNQCVGSHVRLQSAGPLGHNSWTQDDPGQGASHAGTWIPIGLIFWEDTFVERILMGSQLGAQSYREEGLHGAQLRQISVGTIKIIQK